LLVVLIALHLALLVPVAHALPDNYPQEHQTRGDHTDPDDGAYLHADSLLIVRFPFGKNT